MNKVYKVKKRRSADQIGYFKARSVRQKGIRDGTLGLQPKQNESGIWLSPYVQRELAAYRELTKQEWLQCEVVTAKLQMQADKLRRKIISIKENQQRISSSLGVRFKGEESLDSYIIEGRRSQGG